MVSQNVVQLQGNLKCLKKEMAKVTKGCRTPSGGEIENDLSTVNVVSGASRSRENLSKAVAIEDVTSCWTTLAAYKTCPTELVTNKSSLYRGCLCGGSLLHVSNRKIQDKAQL